MKLPPSLITLRLKFPAWSLPTLWLPLFLLWPIVFILALPCIVLGLVVVSLMAGCSAQRFIQCVVTAHQVVCEMRGTLVDVQSADAQVKIQVI